MGVGMMGCWTRIKAKGYPTKLAAKLAKSCRSISQDEAGQFVTETKEIHRLYCNALAKCGELERQLHIAEQTVRLLQVGDETLDEHPESGSAKE